MSFTLGNVTRGTQLTKTVEKSSTENSLVKQPLVSTPTKVVIAALALAQVSNRDVVYDLGCGDGRVPIIAAKYFGAKGYCVELREALCALAEANARLNGVSDKVHIICRDLFETDISNATVVFTYMFPSLNKKIFEKIKREGKMGIRVITIDFPVPGEKVVRYTEVPVEGYAFPRRVFLHIT